MEVFIEFLNLLDVLALHFVSSDTLDAVSIWKDYLIDHYVLNVDGVDCQFLHQSFRFENAEKLRYAHCYESGQFWIFHHLLELFSFGLQVLQLGEDITHLFIGVHSQHGKHALELVFELEDFAQALFDDLGEGEHFEGVSSGCSVENNNLHIHFL